VAIEFECQGCQKTLRVPDEFAGRKAKCPSCQTVLQVPAEVETVEPLEVKPPLTPPAGSGSYSASSPSSFGQAGIPNASPFASSNPYSSPGQYSYGQPSSRGKPHRGGLVLGLGIASLICSLLILCSCLFLIPAIATLSPSLTLGLMDLRAMKEGRMDNQGRGMTLTGTILAAVSAGIIVLIVLLLVLVIVVAIVKGP